MRIDHVLSVGGGSIYPAALLLSLVFPVLRYVLDGTLFEMAARGIVPSRRQRASQANGEGSRRELDMNAPESTVGALRRRRGEPGIAGADATSAGMSARVVTKGMREKREKVKEACWKATVYLFFISYGLYATSSKPWFYDRMQFAPTDKFCPLDCTEETWPQCSHLSVPSDIRFYYVVELAYYIQAILALLFWETRRKDFAVMMMHHVVTVALITYSDVRHQERFGSMVFLLHDVADPPMEIAKLFNYSKNRFMSAVFFLTFVAAWITSRLVYLPAVLIRAVFEATTIQCRHIANRIWVESTRFGGMLIVLFCFHLYW